MLWCQRPSTEELVESMRAECRRHTEQQLRWMHESFTAQVEQIGTSMSLRLLRGLPWDTRAERRRRDLIALRGVIAQAIVDLDDMGRSLDELLSPYSPN